MAASLTACGGPRDCAAEADAQQRDWCYYDVVVEQAEGGSLADAQQTLQRIETTFARTAAINKIFAISPPGLTNEVAIAMCKTLPGRDQDICLNTWNRPHLWER